LEHVLNIAVIVPMTKVDRQQIILSEVQLHNRVMLSDLSILLEVSVDTVRRDVKKLDKEGKLKKVHGGAVSKSFSNAQNPSLDVYAYEAKKVIANKALTLVQEGSVLIISGGTTNLELAKSLPPKLNATIFTPSLAIANQLLDYKNLEVIFIGGKLSRDSRITVGSSAINMVADLQVDICFTGTGYLDQSHGLTGIDWEVVQMKKALFRAAKKVVLLTISEKLNTSQRYKVCNLKAIDTLITELNANDSKLAGYSDQNLKIL